jgi:hypothetical protein
VKDDLATKKRTVIDADGKPVEVRSPRLNAKEELLRVRAFYLDIAHWAVDDPARWARWAAPCPISNAEISRAKERHTARPAWTSGPASGCRSCRHWSAPPPNGTAPLNGDYTPQNTPSQE